MADTIFDAIRGGDAGAVRILLDGDSGLAEATAADGSTPLGVASASAHEEIVALLLTRGADPARASAGAMKAMPLHHAAASGSAGMARLLIGAGAPVDARRGDAPGLTPLMEAARSGDEELLDLLLRHGANPDLRDDNEMSAADHARMSGLDTLAEKLDRSAGLA